MSPHNSAAFVLYLIFTWAVLITPLYQFGGTYMHPEDNIIYCTGDLNSTPCLSRCVIRMHPESSLTPDTLILFMIQWSSAIKPWLSTS